MNAISSWTDDADHLHQQQAGLCVAGSRRTHGGSCGSGWKKSLWRYVSGPKDSNGVLLIFGEPLKNKADVTAAAIAKLPAANALATILHAYVPATTEVDAIDGLWTP
jgi:hypothetical protein